MKDELSRSVGRLRAEGWHCEIAGRRGVDGKTIGLLNFGSIMAIKDDVTMLVQVVSDNYLQEALKRVQNNPSARIWLSSHHRKAVVHSWSTSGPRSWECVEHEVDFRKAKKS